jgi:hypothetical protein
MHFLEITTNLPDSWALGGSSARPCKISVLRERHDYSHISLIFNLPTAPRNGGRRYIHDGPGLLGYMGVIRASMQVRTATFVDRRPHRFIQSLILGFTCCLLALPTELHSTVVEVHAHDAPRAVSVDARHAEQEAHFEHSAVEMRAHCAACTLTKEPKAASILSVGGNQDPPKAGLLLSIDLHSLDTRSERHTPSRAPPLR